MDEHSNGLGPLLNSFPQSLLMHVCVQNLTWMIYECSKKHRSPKKKKLVPVRGIGKPLRHEFGFLSAHQKFPNQRTNYAADTNKIQEVTRSWYVQYIKIWAQIRKNPLTFLFSEFIFISYTHSRTHSRTNTFNKHIQEHIQEQSTKFTTGSLH